MIYIWVIVQPKPGISLICLLFRCIQKPSNAYGFFPCSDCILERDARARSFLFPKVKGKSEMSFPFSTPYPYRIIHLLILIRWLPPANVKMSGGEFLSTYVIVYDCYLLLFSILASTLFLLLVCKNLSWPRNLLFRELYFMFFHPLQALP